MTADEWRALDEKVTILCREGRIKISECDGQHLAHAADDEAKSLLIAWLAHRRGPFGHAKGGSA